MLFLIIFDTEIRLKFASIYIYKVLGTFFIEKNLPSLIKLKMILRKSVSKTMILYIPPLTEILHLNPPRTEKTSFYIVLKG